MQLWQGSVFELWPRGGAADQRMGRGGLLGVCPSSGKPSSTPRRLVCVPRPIVSTVRGRWKGVDDKETGTNNF